MQIKVHKFAGQKNIGTVVDQIHLHSTANAKATIENEVEYLVDNGGHKHAYYTHIVGQGKVYQVANVGKGAWDVGGGWNHHTYAAIEFSELVHSKDEFIKTYKLYISLARQLAKQAGIQMKYNSGTKGIMTHSYCTHHQPANKSDHEDPLAFLAKWGITESQLKHDIEHGITGEVKLVTSKSAAKVAAKATSKKSTGSTSIKTVQTWFNATYHTGIKVDGLTGPASRKAGLKALQTELNRQFDAGLTVDGLWGVKTKAATVVVKRGAKGNITKIIQGLLILAGYDPKGFDGDFGEGCEAALAKFQKARGLDDDGRFGPVSAKKLVA